MQMPVYRAVVLFINRVLNSLKYKKIAAKSRYFVKEKSLYKKEYPTESVTTLFFPSASLLTSFNPKL